ncbi:hypothetical protein C8T65DRAFT_673703 [Cerioporus squamosus]|nr:hypothetical protein C8T65DRAFT_673703 [Cerioporus squamosus]
MSDESRQVAIPGRFVRSERSWQWKALFSQGEDAAHRELDLAISARTFFHGPMPDLMKAQAWFCTVRYAVCFRMNAPF